MTHNGTAIQCRQLSRRYGEIEALKPLDLSVPAGSVFGYLGRNGAGKTTTIRLLTGLAQPTTGSAWVAGVETTKADSTARSQFGYLPQNPAFYNWMTAWEFLDYVAQLFSLDAQTRRRRIDEMLELVGLQEDAKRPIRGFSGGMIQRLGIAQAFIHRPPVLFLDEPTSSLDPAGRYEVLSLIESLRGQVTVFLSSHILADVERVCDTVAIIRKGELLLVAERDDLLARYASNVIQLEFDPNGTVASDAFRQQLEAQPWVTAISHEAHQMRLTVSEPDTARQALFPLIVEHQVPLNKYEWKRPSLEEVFLTISE